MLEAIAQRVCGMTRIRSTPSRWVPSTSASSAASVTRPPGLRKILASPGFRPSIRRGSIRESMHVTIATPACATPSKPPSSKSVGELAVGGDQVLEVGHAARSGAGKTVRPGPPRSGRPAQRHPRLRSSSAVSRARVRAPRKSTRASTPATTAHPAAPAKTVCSWAMPAVLSRSVNSSHRLPPSQTVAHGRQVGLLGVVAAQPDRGQRGDPDQHPDHPGHHDQRGGRGRGRRRRCWRARPR